MNEHVKKKWVEALRSGEYKQGKTVLHSGDHRFCCLGVLCDLAVRDGVDVDVRSSGSGNALQKLYDFEGQLLPQKVKDWAGLDSHNPDVSGRPLAHWNDHTEVGFDKIADMIEEEL